MAQASMSLADEHQGPGWEALHLVVDFLGKTIDSISAKIQRMGLLTLQIGRPTSTVRLICKRQDRHIN
jgi:hypothetical protein